MSLYGLLDEFSDASVHRSLSEISPLVDDPRYRSHLMIGGDLNTGAQWPANDPFNDRDRNVLERLSALGLVDCVDRFRPSGRLEGCPCRFGDACRHVRTRLDRRRPHVPYQTDYFASREMSEKIVACTVLSEDRYFKISDHAPIVADFFAPS